MQRMRFMIKQFQREPLWFKILIVMTLLTSIILSSSFFSGNIYNQSISKLAAAIFFIAYGIKMRKNLKTAVLFFILAAISLYLSALPVFLT
ncbi:MULTISPECIES: hypothetical protein [unclassified Bacillus (in: firmicutes)]|uniref:hypothetical protein n=1 Tax=unclassified Bacillus (in: firmicutes) TaxID=185979 RepID=UPI0008E59057|nr:MULTISPECIES: hypothetical protein [unclassified Bacillus (in: firmicutes)]SFA70041.1 hypothetical protein SAMN02799634_10178 [Bacillus sp. UNCCL13]SFQ59522.1 hypothetical protein SAMN04488577_0362 [Bacillus sp. cl95]